MKEAFIRIGITGATVAVCLVLAEVLGRQTLSYVTRKTVTDMGGFLEANPEELVEYTARGRRMVPHADVMIHNHYVSKLDVDIKTNALGLRDPERSERPAPGTDRVVMLGDSIVVQDYLPSESTLVRILERSLSSARPNGVEMVNAGLSNFGLEEEYDLLSDVIDKVNPTAVLLSFYLNDSRPAWGFAGELGNKRAGLRRYSIVYDTIVRELEVRRWLDSSKVDRFQWMGLVDTTPWRTDRGAFQAMAEAARFDWGSAWDDESWAAVERSLKKIVKLVQARGARLGVVIMPVRYQVEAEFLEDSPQRRVGAILDELGVPHLSVLELARAHKDEDLFFDWCHPTEHGNRLFAPPIQGFVEQHLLGNLGSDR